MRYTCTAKSHTRMLSNDLGALATALCAEARLVYYRWQSRALRRRKSRRLTNAIGRVVEGLQVPYNLPDPLQPLHILIPALHIPLGRERDRLRGLLVERLDRTRRRADDQRVVGKF